MRIVYCIIVTAAAVLSGCQSTPVATTPASITFKDTYQMNLGETTARAQEHCKQYGKNAQYVPDGIQDGITTFHCV
ncbi:hypothetical protein [Hoeflea sp. TYP-13]|uniref:hypothetical protein n=1 Tax=Hoeflea sp. TYP-13 TaxID=3230023 RepID=UPI0034C64D9E